MLKTKTTLSTRSIACGGTFQVALSIAAESENEDRPVDLALLLDCSNSMAGEALAQLKHSVNRFLSLLLTPGREKTGAACRCSRRIGIVSFSDCATQAVGLTDDPEALNTAVCALRAAGKTNHADAFSKGASLLSASNGRRIIVLFTDGRTTAGGCPADAARAARESGAEIYVIGLTGRDGLDVAALESWASQPAKTHVAIASDCEALTALFEHLARTLCNPYLNGVIVNEQLDRCFEIVSISAPSQGKTRMTGSRSLRWTPGPLVPGEEAATLTYTVRHTGDCSGTVKPSQAVACLRDQTVANFPSPELRVCCEPETPEPCPDVPQCTIRSCQRSMEFDAGSVCMQPSGCVLRLSVTLQNVCPHRRMALAAFLTEEDDEGLEHPRGMRVIAVPAHEASCHQDVTVRNLMFILPDEPDGDQPPCHRHKFKVRFLAHEINAEFSCGEDALWR